MSGWRLPFVLVVSIKFDDAPYLPPPTHEGRHPLSDAVVVTEAQITSVAKRWRGIHEWYRIS